MDEESESPSPNPRPSAGASELQLLDEVERIFINRYPHEQNDFLCPACEQPIPWRNMVPLGKPAKYYEFLNDVYRCPLSRPDTGLRCQFIFSPKSITATVLRR